MSNVHTLKDIEDRGAVGGLLGKQIPPGWLSSIRESELEKALRGSIKSASDIANDYKDLQDLYLERVKDFNRICSGLNNKFNQLNTANTELEAKYTAEIQSLKSKTKTLKREGTLAQKTLFADKIQIISLETKIRKLEGKLEDIDLERTYHDLDVMGGVIQGPAQISSSNPKEIDSLRLELDRVKEDLMDMDEATKHESSRAKGHEASPDWPFSMLVTGKSGSGKTNILANLFLGNKAECIYKNKKGPKDTSYGSRYIACDDLIVCGYHL